MSMGLSPGAGTGTRLVRPPMIMTADFMQKQHGNNNNNNSIYTYHNSNNNNNNNGSNSSMAAAAAASESSTSFVIAKPRMRICFDPETEIPRLQQWFAENNHPTRQQVRGQ